MSLAYTGRLGEAIVEVHRPNDIRQTPNRFDFILKPVGTGKGPDAIVHTSPSAAELGELLSALHLLTLSHIHLRDGEPVEDEYSTDFVPRDPIRSQPG